MPAGDSRSKLGRREFLFGAGAAAAVACGTGPGARKGPNIIFAFADDQSWPHAGACGDPVVQTPAFDRIAGEGVRFTNSFSACPSCTPSRSAVLTGRHIWQVEEGGVLYGTLPAKYPIYTHLLEDSGYHVGSTGKGWVPGNWNASGHTRYPTGREYNERKMREPVAEGIDVRDYAGNFDEFLTARPADSPFCFWFGCTEPHRVYEQGIGLKSGKRLEDVKVPAYWPDTPTVRSDILDYYYEVEWFDKQLAKMLARLEEMGELENTLVVVTSDNGMPFPRAKVNLYDPGVHMPLAVRWGGRLSGDRVIDDFVSHTDFAPTFLEAAGVAVPDSMTGRSLLPMLESGASGVVEPGRDHVYTGMERHTWCRPNGGAYPMRSLRNREYLYLRNFEPDRWPTGGPEFVSSNKTFHGDVDACSTKTFMVQKQNRERYSEQYDLCFGKRPLEELYDVKADPDQIHNLAGSPEHAGVKTQMWDQMRAFLKETGDPRIDGQDPWQEYVYHQTIGYGASFNRSLPEEERERARARDTHKPE